MGKANIILGGPGGRNIKLEQGDVILLPAGAGHKCLTFTKDFYCVGAYPQGKEYDMNYGTADELKKALITLKKIPLPLKDPVFGNEGFLKMYWN